jgi:hypothetical protein
VRIPAKYTRTGRGKQAGCLCYCATGLGHQVRGRIQVGVGLGALDHPQRELLPCFKAGIVMIGDLKPAIVIGTEVGLIFAETKPIECPVKFLAPDPNGEEILIFQRIDVHDFGGNWSHGHCFPRVSCLLRSTAL